MGDDMFSFCRSTRLKVDIFYCIVCSRGRQWQLRLILCFCTIFMGILLTNGSIVILALV